MCFFWGNIEMSTLIKGGEKKTGQDHLEGKKTMGICSHPTKTPQESGKKHFGVSSSSGLLFSPREKKTSIQSLRIQWDAPF